jgi:hypothetical protein
MTFALTAQARNGSQGSAPRAAIEQRIGPGRPLISQRSECCVASDIRTAGRNRCFTRWFGELDLRIGLLGSTWALQQAHRPRITSPTRFLCGTLDTFIPMCGTCRWSVRRYGPSGIVLLAWSFFKPCWGHQTEGATRTRDSSELSAVAIIPRIFSDARRSGSASKCA